LTIGQLVSAGGPPDFSSYQYSDAPKVDFEPSYDFCIVGGGTAGLVLANRLTESGKHKVIVFEAGPTPDTVATSETAGGNQFVLNGGFSLIDYNFVTVPQTNLNNRTLNYHRGRALGGSSSTNGLYYGLGSSTVYDQWETDGNPGWNWYTVSAAAKQGTVFVGNPDNTNDNTYMTWDPKNYGTEGPLKIGFQGYVVTSNPSFMNATSAIGIDVVHDQNGGSPVGVKQGTMTLDENFKRSSSYTSYYEAAKGRPNLNVRDRAIVARIIFDEETIGTDEVHVVGLTFVDSGIFHNISCSNEVIIAGGAFHSPFILKQSGIGPQDELEKYGIPVVVANENVGQHMQDHTSFSVIYSVKPEYADVASTTDMVRFVRVLVATNRIAHYV
jgi:choline dehydrogenase-like flavoprotein